MNIALENTHTPHVFAIPSLMTHLWIRKLSKDSDVLFTINVGPSFRPSSICEALVVVIILPLAHVSNYRGPWVLCGSSPALGVQDHLEVGFKHPELHECG